MKAIFISVSALFLLATSCSSDGVPDEPTGKSAEPVVWDMVARPIPTAYLYMKSPPGTPANNCRLAGTTSVCDSMSCPAPCADANGLVTEAGKKKTTEYYTAIGESGLTTLQKWKDYYGFKRPGIGETLAAFRARSVGTSTKLKMDGNSSSADVVYYNDTQLALGRVLGCAKKGVLIGCYVSNYGDTFESVKDPARPDGDAENQDADGMWDAVFGRRPKNTVVISYHGGSTRPADARVQFAAYGPDGGRLDKAQLDYMGSRFIPGICITCHGGGWDITKTNFGKSGMVTNARFLPIVNTNVLFSNNAPYRMRDQEEAIRDVNAYAWHTSGGTMGGTSLTERQKLLLGWMYVAGTANGGSLNFAGLCTNSWQPCGVNAQCPSGTTCDFNRQWTDNAWPGGWEDHTQLYHRVVHPYCDSCHMALDDGMSLAIGNGFDNGLVSFSPFVQAIAQSYLGFTPEFGWTNDRSNLKMPHSQPTFSRFWGDHSLPGGVSPGEQLFRDIYLVTPPPPPDALQAQGWGTQCGQADVTPSTPTAASHGANSGRLEAHDSGSHTCRDACYRNFNFCPGSEKTWGPSTLGSRMQCIVNNSPLPDYGYCQSCGGAGTAPCGVGAGCDTAANPNCATSKACHEGASNGTVCAWANISQGKMASHCCAGNSPNLAVDGNTNGNSFSLTGTTPNAWWMVDLGGIKAFKEIEIYPRAGTNLSNFKVQKCGEDTTKICGSGTSDSNWTTVGADALGNPASHPGDFSNLSGMPNGVTRIVLQKPEKARYIRVKLNGTAQLALAEVKVFGTP